MDAPHGAAAAGVWRKGDGPARRPRSRPRLLRAGPPAAARRSPRRAGRERPSVRISQAFSASCTPRPPLCRGPAPAPCDGGDWRAARRRDAVRGRRLSSSCPACCSWSQTMPGSRTRASDLRACAEATAVAKSGPPAVMRMCPHGSGVEHSLGKGEVGGSNPPVGTIFPQGVAAIDWKGRSRPGGTPDRSPLPGRVEEAVALSRSSRCHAACPVPIGAPELPGPETLGYALADDSAAARMPIASSITALIL